MPTGPQRYRVLVVDDNTTARMGARALMAASPNFTLVGEATSGEEALSLLAETRPDVVLMDVHMDGMGGVETTRRILRANPSLPVVAWTSSVDSDDLVAMMQAGCVGYTLKDLGPSELNKALLLAVRGETPIPRQLVPDLVRRVSPPPEQPPVINLTRRERDVLRHLVRGGLTKEIARALGISAKSVESHASRIYAKLGAKNRSQAAALAVRWGLVTDDQ